MWQLKIHGIPQGQANEPLNNAPSLKNSQLTKRRKLYRMLPDLRKSEWNLWRHTITQQKLASYHNKVAAILISLLWNGCFHRETNQKFQFLPQSNFFYLPFANNEKNPASFLDMG